MGADAETESARLTSECNCRVQTEQAEAWTAASTATAAHAADWKQAHEVICALGKKIPCDTVPDCPALEQVTLSKDISSEDCTQALAETTVHKCIAVTFNEGDKSCLSFAAGIKLAFVPASSYDCYTAEATAEPTTEKAGRSYTKKAAG